MTCHVCGREVLGDEFVWASEWRVIEPGGVRLETRYTCDDCEASA